MPPGEWQIPRPLQPRPEDYPFDLERALSAVVGVTTVVPADAFTADTLGTERAGNAVVIDTKGVVLTIGYLVTEASSIWLTTNDGRAIPADVIAYDQETGFGLLQALARLSLPAIPLGTSGQAALGDRVVVAGGGGRQRSVVSRIVAKQEFAGYWEYLLEEAIFISPPHPHWGGTAVIGGRGELLGIGSLQLQQDRGGDRDENLNMIVPIDLLKPILPAMLSTGRSGRPSRPWLGLYATEMDGHVVVAGLVDRGPADSANLQIGDLIVTAAGQSVGSLADFYRAVWASGAPGAEIPLQLQRSGRPVELAVTSTDRNGLLKRKTLH